MKKYAIIPILAFAACTGGGDQKNATSSPDTTTSVKEVAPASGEYCYLHTEGAGNVDTTTVHLIIDGNKVTGDMNWIPKEKDRRKGTLAGTITHDEISAVWSFMQEGVKDSLQLSFQLSPGQLTQKLSDGRTVWYNVIHCGQ